MKKPLAIRIDANLLAAARECAAFENRTLTNFIETVLRRHIAVTRGEAFVTPATVAGPEAQELSRGA